MTSTDSYIPMYNLKPYQSDVVVELPSNMYKTKSYHTAAPGPGDQEAGGPVAVLAARQAAALQRLEGLRQRVAAMAQHYSLPDPAASSPPSSSSPASGQAPAPGATCGVVSSLTPCIPASGSGALDVVVSADPARPPLSLLVLAGRLAQACRLLQATHVHSSVSGCVPAPLTTMLTSGAAVARGEAQVALTLVWKKVTRGPVMVVDPTRGAAVAGEANVARFLHRLVEHSEDALQATQTDELLDLCQLGLLEGGSKERAAALRTLNAALGRAPWLSGAEPGLADIVAWSAVQQAVTAAPPAHVARWLKACSGHAWWARAAALATLTA